MKPKLIITAANGFIGQSLIKFFEDKYDVVAIARKPFKTDAKVRFVAWDGESFGNWAKEFEGATAVINLAGKSVNCRYTKENKTAIYTSRLWSTKVIGEAIENCKNKPKVWLNAASATIYEHSERVPNTEMRNVIGHGFSVDVCKKWEEALFDFKIDGVRQIAMRTAIVLGKNGGVMRPFKNLARVGLGGKMANGKQMFSWIHELDVCRICDYLIEDNLCEGVYNISAPNPVSNEAFAKTLRKKMSISFGIPQPKWLLKLGAKLIGTETELIFKSRFVLPEKLLNAGFEFKFKTIDVCLEDLIHTEKKN